MKVREDLFAVRADKKSSKVLEKRRIKFYDMLSDEEEEAEQSKTQIEIAESNQEFLVQKSEKGIKGGRPRKQIKPEVDDGINKDSSALNLKNNKKKFTKKEMNQQEKLQKLSEEKEDKGIENENEEGDEESPTKDESVNKYLLKKKRLRKQPAIDKEDIDDSKIISEVNIDYGKV